MSRRDAYLDALGVTRWAQRPDAGRVSEPKPEPEPSEARPGVTSPEAVPLYLGDGDAACLLVCARAGDSAGVLASDLARSLGQPPVWGWPDPDQGGSSPEEVAGERLFTTIAILGEATASLVFGGGIPAECGSARVVVLPDMQRLETSVSARQSCWDAMKKSGMVRRA